MERRGVFCSENVDLDHRLLLIIDGMCPQRCTIVIAAEVGGYVRCAAQTKPSLLKKDISPHTFRHAAGMMLVSAGTDVTVIRSILGHERLDTTNRYAHANLETKRKALEQASASADPGSCLVGKEIQSS
jgi:integrase